MKVLQTKGVKLCSVPKKDRNIFVGLWNQHNIIGTKVSQRKRYLPLASVQLLIQSMVFRYMYLETCFQRPLTCFELYLGLMTNNKTSNLCRAFCILHHVYSNFLTHCTVAFLRKLFDNFINKASEF